MRAGIAGRRFRWALLVSMTVAIMPGAFVLWRTVGYYRVKSAIARYESGPSQAGVDELTELLKRRAATREQGTRILKLLLWPKVTTQPAYPAGKPVRVTLESIYSVHFAYLWARQDVQAEDGRVVDRRNRRITIWSTVPDSVLVHPSPQEPGVCRAVIHYDCTATYETTCALIWRYLFRSPCPNTLRTRIYTCRFDVPVKVNVVATDAPG